MRTFIVLIILPVWLSGCKPVLRATGYLKNPKKEDSLSIVNFINKEQAQYNALFIPKGPEAFKDFISTVTNKCPAVLIFNKAGEDIYSDQTCAWVNVKRLDSLEQLAPTSKKVLALEKMLALLSPVNGALPQDEYDYFVFYTWAKYSPKLSSQMINDINRFGGTATHRIFIGSINLDLQRSWD